MRSVAFILLVLLAGCSAAPPPPVSATLENIGIGYSEKQVREVLGEPASEMTQGQEKLLLFKQKDTSFNIRVTLRKDSLVIVTGTHLQVEGKVYEPGTTAQTITEHMGEHDERVVRWAGWEQLTWLRGKTAIKVVFRDKIMSSAEIELLPEFAEPEVQ